MTRAGSVAAGLAAAGAVFAAVLLLYGCQGVLPAPERLEPGDYAAVWTYLNRRIPREMDRYQVKGLSIALVDERGVLWAQGFGMADSQKGVPAQSDTLYRIGSVTKPLTALIVLRLQEQGLLDIDDPLKDYLPEFSIHNRFHDRRPITLRALLSHHSGLPSDRLAGMWVDAPASLDELVGQISNESMASAQETQYRYSNLGYSLLGRVIEVVTRKPYAQVVEDELFGPLQMRASAVSSGSEALTGLAAGYRAGKPYPILPLRDLPAGAIASSVDDLAGVLTLLLRYGDGYLSAESIAEAFRPQYPGLPLDFGHEVGFDWQLDGLNLPGGERVAWHNGTAYPHQAHVALLREQGLAVVILSNTMEASRFITDLGRDALALLLAAKRGGVADLGKGAAKNPVRVELSAQALGQYAGRYTVLGQLAEFRSVDNHLETHLWDRSIEMLPTGPGAFTLRTRALGVFPVPLNQLQLKFEHVAGYDVAVLRGITAPLVFTRIPKNPVPEAWRQRLGAYRVDTRGEAFEIRRLELGMEQGLLVADTSVSDLLTGNGETRIRMPLIPVSDDEAVLWGVANGEGGTLRYVGQGRLYYSGFLLEPEQVADEVTLQ